jgi:hypothetical protein
LELQAALNGDRTKAKHAATPISVDELARDAAACVAAGARAIPASVQEKGWSGDVGRVEALETLPPAQRLAYVLHDMFSVPFEEIGVILERSPEAARQLASRARRRIRAANTTPHAADAAAQQEEVVEAFLAAARDGDFDALLAVLDPDIVERVDTGSGTIVEVRGAQNVARRALAAASQRGLVGRVALINGAPGWVSVLDGELYAIAALTVQNGRITRMDILLDPARLTRLDLTVFS